MTFNPEAMGLINAAAILAAGQLSGKPTAVVGPQSTVAVFNAALELVTHRYLDVCEASEVLDRMDAER
jgi:hypothetical protein